MNWQPIATAPENEWLILGSTEFRLVTFGIVMDGKCYNPDLGYQMKKNITHFMYLPDGPKESE